MKHDARTTALLAFAQFCFLIVSAASAFSLPNPSPPGTTLKPSDAPIPANLFGMIIHRLATSTPWPSVRFGTIRLWDSYTVWPNLEPEKGKWDFSGADKYVSSAEQNHVEVFFPLALSPRWASSDPSLPYDGHAAPPKNIDDWTEYVRTVATRYKGRVHSYEIWNEPNLELFYKGSIPQLLQLACTAYQTLKQIDSSSVVSSPAFTALGGLNMFDQYLKAGGAKCSDVIGYHLYVNPAPPEEMVPLIQQVKGVMNKNGVGNKMLWDTETGWAIQNADGNVKPAPGKGFNSIVFSADQAAGYVARAYLLSWASGVSRLYWFSWDNGVMGLTDKDGKTLKAPARAYAELQNWLIGARMVQCGSDSTEIWYSVIDRDGGYRGWIIWHPTGPMGFLVPKDWQVRNVRDLQGGTQKLNIDGKIQIGQTPILLEHIVP